MIVRILGEGQVRLDDSHFPLLDRLDDELMAELESGDETGFRRTLQALLEAVSSVGTPLPDEALEPSELILPSPDASIEEVRAMLTENGLIPGLPDASGEAGGGGRSTSD
ncbi:PspA-associated protein PspAA [Streptomyces sp. 4N509B]|uniref:PspA-associated protein PspAA n=1 Tax=Streptomyces sp. 4N509B TaxID=3457413 RepID=UPI003FD15049